MKFGESRPSSSRDIRLPQSDAVIVMDDEDNDKRRPMDSVMLGQNAVKR